MKNLNRKKLFLIHKEKGVTLIALIVSIIVVLILASVSIAVFSNSNIIKKSKFAGENYQSKINEEEKAMQNYASTMNEYTIADTGRDTVTINKEELNALIEQVVNQKIQNNTNFKSGIVEIPKCGRGNQVTKTITFSKPFTDANYAITITSAFNGDYWAQAAYTIENKTINGFTIRMYQWEGTQPVHNIYYIAIPYDN